MIRTYVRPEVSRSLSVQLGIRQFRVDIGSYRWQDRLGPAWAGQANYGSRSSGLPRLTQPQGGAMYLGTILVDQIVVHDVPRNNTTTTPADIVYSDAASPLTAELRNFFKGKTTQSLGRHGYAVEHDPEQASPVPALI